jgi:outer membrane protein assembly factor BamA
MLFKATEPRDKAILTKYIPIDTQLFLTPDLRDKFFEKQKWRLYAVGYLSAVFTYNSADSQHLNIWVCPGKKYQYAQLNIPVEWKSLALKYKIQSGTTVETTKLSAYANAVISYMENHGYPFATASLHIKEATDSTITGTFVTDKETYFSFDTLTVEGNAYISKRYLENYLGIKPDEPYSELKVQKIDQLLDRLHLIKRTKSSQIYFVYNKTFVKLFIDDRKTDRFDGIVGFAPNSTNYTNKDLLLTGEINLDLKNIQGTGIAALAGWRSYLQRSQELKFESQIPFILNSPVVAGFSANITRFDSLFLNTRFDISAGIFQAGNRQISFEYGKFISSLLNPDTSAVRQKRKLPANNPFEINNYSFNLFWNQTDRIANPVKGFVLEVKATLGSRIIIKDQKIDKVLFRSPKFPNGISVYDTVQLKSLRFEIQFNHQLFVPLKKHSTILIEGLGKYLLASNLFFNELYRMGGFSTLRGFDEQSIFAGTFSMLNLEYRYLINEASFAGFFFNAAYYENRSNISTRPIADFPIGFGFSGQINTRNALLQFAYALGSQKNQSLAFRTAKIHIGIVNYL